MSASLSIWSPLKNHKFLCLFLAQCLAVFGTGLTGIALALQAQTISISLAGGLLGTALMIKMVAYVSLSPIAGGYADRLPTKTWLISLDIIRAGMVFLVAWLSLLTAPPLIWMIVILFIMYGASALFSPVFQSQIPRLFEDEQDYTAALALSRFVFDLEQILTPAFAALFLVFGAYTMLFDATSLCFLGSAVLIYIVRLPDHIRNQRPKGIFYNIFFGMRCYLATPRLQSVLVLSLIASLAGATVIVNSIALVGQYIDLNHLNLTLLLGCAGSGALAVALIFPRLSRHISLRHLMLIGAIISAVGMVCAAFSLFVFGETAHTLYLILPSWCLIGIGSSLIQIPIGKIITQSSAQTDRTAYFSAQFGLSHFGWLFAYALSGWGGVLWGLPHLFLATAVLILAALCLAYFLWPFPDPMALPHTHKSVTHIHPHDHTDPHHQHHNLSHKGHDHAASEDLHDHAHSHAEMSHSHDFTIDAHHTNWPVKRSFFKKGRTSS